jgi:hypothetical protein
MKEAHMKLSKKIAAVAVAGALGVAAVTPAMALENEFSGIYNLRFYLSNVDNGTAAAIVPSTTLANKNKANNYFEQRARVKYTAKASDDLKLVTFFELDSKFGGQGPGAAYKGTASGNDAGQLDADSLTLETKNVYLDFNVGKNFNAKTGVQTLSDKFKGIFISFADVAGINTTTKVGNLALNAGYFRLAEGILATGNSKTGHDQWDLALLDAQFNVSKDVSVGAAYYLSSDYRTNLPVTVHTLGAYGAGKVGALTLSGFAAMQTGYNNSAVGVKQQKSGYAANMGAKLPIGPGTLKAAYLYTSGDDARDNRDTSWFSIKNGASSLSSYNESGAWLLNRNINISSIGSTDRSVVYAFGDQRNPGYSILSVGYDANITPKVFANVNAAVGFASKNQSVTAAGGKNGSNMLGTEINLETGYKVYDNLTAKIQAAYLILGGYYNGNNSLTPGKNAENPYTTRVVLQYAF